MKAFLTLVASLLVIYILPAQQNVGIDENNPNQKLSVNGKIEIGDDGAAATAGSIKYDGNNFYGYDGSNWLNLSSYEAATDPIEAYIAGNPDNTNMSNSTIAVSDTSGVIYDSGGPNGIYGINENLTHRIFPSTGYLFNRVIIAELETEANNDILTIYNTDQSYDFSGNSGVPDTLFFDANDVLTIEFSSNAINSIPYAGYKIEWSRVGGDLDFEELTNVTGFYFNPKKLSFGGGANINGSWATDTIGRSSINFGFGSKAKGENSITLGNYARSDIDDGIAIGRLSEAYGDYPISIGLQAKAIKNYSIAIGGSARAFEAAAIAIGDGALSSQTSGIALGGGSLSNGFRATAIGKGSLVNNEYTTAVGALSRADGPYSVALGGSAESFYEGGIAVGGQTLVDATEAIAIGRGAQATELGSIAVGAQANTAAESGISIGKGASIIQNASFSIALGVNASAMQSNSLAIGFAATSDSLRSIAIGSNARTIGSRGVSLGFNATSFSKRSVAIGVSAQAEEQYAVAIGSTSKAKELSVAIGSSSNANGVGSISIGDDSGATGDGAIAMGGGAKSLADRSIVIGDGAIANDTSNIVIGGKGNYFDGFNYGYAGAKSYGNKSVTIGNGAIGSTKAIVIGSSSFANKNSVVLGFEALDSGSGSSVVIGDGTYISGDSTISIGGGSKSIGSKNVAIGVESSAGDFFGLTSHNSIAIGFRARAVSDNSVEIGNANITSIGGAVDWSIVSDARFKTNVKETVPGLDFISKLRPVTYNLDMMEMVKYKGGKAEPGQLSSLKTGFIAQEVEQAALDVNYDFSAVRSPQNEKDHYSLSYAQFVVPLVKAAQELDEENQKLKHRLDQMEEFQTALLKRLEALEAGTVAQE